MSSLHDPFDLLDTDTRIVPVLTKNKLDAMVEKALLSPQEKPSADQAPRSTYGRTYWWSGTSVAVAACLLLLIGGHQTPTPDFDPAGTPIVISESAAPTNIASNNHVMTVSTTNDDGDIGDMVVLATLDSQ